MNCISSHTHLHSLVESARGMSVVLDARFRFVAASPEYAAFRRCSQADLLGTCLFDLFASGSLPGVDGALELRASLLRVRRRGVADAIPVRKYRIYPSREKTDFASRYWSVFNSPIFDANGQVAYILHHVEDMTGFVPEADNTKKNAQTPANRSLADINEQLRAFIENSPVALAMFDGKMRYLQASRRWIDEYCGGAGDLIGRSHYAVFPNLPKRWKQVHRLALAGEVVRSEEERWEKANGSVRWLRWEVRPWHDSSGSIGGIVIFTEDITERKNVEKALAERNALLDIVFKTAPVGLGFVDADFRVIRFNEALAAFGGTTPEHAVGQTVAELAPDLWPTLAPLYRSTLAGQSIVDRRIFGEAKPGDHRHWRVSYYPVRVGREIIGVGIVAADITETERSERALRESEERFRQLIQGLPAAVYACDTAGRILLYNAEAVKLWGREPDLKRDRWCGSYRIYDADEKRLPRKRLAVAQAVRDDEPIQAVERIIERPDGSRSYVLAYPDPLHDSQGRVTGAVNLYFDITPLKNTENILRATERKLRTLSRAVEQSPASVLITNPSGEIEYVNPTFSEVTGYSIAEVIGKNPRILKSGHQPPEFYRTMWETIKAGRDWRGEFCNRKKNGEEIWEFAVIAPIHDASGEITHFVAIKEDITQRRLALEALHDREERLRAILDTVMDAVVTIDREGKIVSVNRATEHMFGYPEPELLGQNVSILTPSPYCDEQWRFLEPHRRGNVASINGAGREGQARRKDGSIFPIELAVSEVHHLRLFTGVIHDITQRRRLEAEVLQISEDERQRVAADLHDGICQELIGISFGASAVQRDLENTHPKLASKMKDLAAAISQAAAHTRAVARGMSPVVADKDGLMQALRQLASSTARAHRLRCVFQCRRPVVIDETIVANQLYRIAQEAIQNAIRHGKPKRISITLRNDRGGVHLAIRDNGNGLSEKSGSNQGIGFRTMQYRASLLGGQLSLKPGRRGGTEVLCRLPAALQCHEESV